MKSLILFACNPPALDVFLARNPNTKHILSLKDSKAIAKFLLDIAKKTTRDKVSADSEVGVFIRGIFTGEKIFDFSRKAMALDPFRYLFDPVSIDLIQEHLNKLTYPAEHPQNAPNEQIQLAPDFTEFQDDYDTAQEKHLIKSTFLLNNPTVLYKYVSKNKPIVDENVLLEKLERQLTTLTVGTKLDLFILTGGHGNEVLINNLSKDLFIKVTALFQKYKVTAKMIALDCCLGALHINELKPLLTPDGSIIANFSESRGNCILSFFQDQNNDSNLNNKLLSILNFNNSTILYNHAKKTVHSIDINSESPPMSRSLSLEAAQEESNTSSPKITHQKKLASAQTLLFFAKPSNQDSYYKSKLGKFETLLKQSNITHKPLSHLKMAQQLEMTLGLFTPSADSETPSPFLLTL